MTAHAGSVAIDEVDVGDNTIVYNVYNHGATAIAIFAVTSLYGGAGNPPVDSKRPYWGAEKLSRTDWDLGTITFHFGDTPETAPVKYIAGGMNNTDFDGFLLGDFASVFGNDDNFVHVYWAATPEAEEIGAHGGFSENQFKFFNSPPTSVGAAWGNGGEIIESRIALNTPVGSVPEPAILALLCVGLAGLGYSRSRKI